MWDVITHKWLQVPYALHVHTDNHIENPRATVLFIHGIGNSGAAWQDTMKGLPGDVRLITIDLLGFGRSKQPPWAVYSAKTQARSVLATFLKLRVRGRVIIVGHSLGALVAVEIAKRYPLLVRSLILCSPPFYKVDPKKRNLLPRSDDILKEMYRIASRYPDQIVRLSTVAVKLGLVNDSFNLTRDNAPTYMNALESTIINQTSLQDALKLTVPTRIIHGQLDPVVVGKNLRYLVKENRHITLTNVLAGHEVKGLFVKATTKAINEAIKE